MTKVKFHTFNPNDLRNYVTDVFKWMGVNTKDAELATDVLITSDLRGIDSHGVARLHNYVKLWQKGIINPNPNIKIIHQTPSTASIDGDAGLGLVVAPKAMQIAIDKSNNVGSGWVSVSNSNHFGIAQYHSLLATKQNMIGLAMTNAAPFVAPTFAKEKMLGTNPICYTFPSRKYNPLVADLATSTAAVGKLEIAQRNKKDIPTGWVQDIYGNPAIDPYALKNGGALVPLGSDRDHGSHKGYCLSSVVDILTAVLSGASYGPWAPPTVDFFTPMNDQPGKGLGHFLGAMRIDGFRPADEFLDHMDNWIDRFKNAERIDPNQPVLIPGEPEFEMEQIRLKDGIPLVEGVVANLKQVSEIANINFPKEL